MTSMDSAVDMALMAALRASAAFGMVSGRVYGDDAPFLFPRVQFLQTTGMDTNLQARREGHYRYTVKAVVSEDDGGSATAQQIADAIDAALHNQPLTALGNWSIDDCERLTAVRYIEMDNGKKYYHRGGVYRIRVTAHN